MFEIASVYRLALINFTDAFQEMVLCISVVKKKCASSHYDVSVNVILIPTLVHFQAHNFISILLNLCQDGCNFKKIFVSVTS